MSDFLDQLFSSGGFIPHGYCLAWDGPLLWTLVVSNLLIGLAYYSIPLAIWWFLRSQQKIQFNWIFVMFGLFIMACGTTHILDVINIWTPVYRLDALVLIVTAAVSVATAVLLWPMIPEAIAFLKDRQVALEKLQEANFRLRESFDELDESSRRLRIRERELRTTISNAPIGMAIVELGGRFQVVNEALCNMLGYTSEELTQLRFQDITPDTDLDANLTRANDLIAGFSGSYRQEKHYRHKSGHYIDVQMDVSLLRDEQGAPLHLIAQIQDITERKQLEKKLRDNNLKLESSLSQIIRWNREISALSELSKTLQYCDSLDELGTAFGSIAEALFSQHAGTLYVIGRDDDELTPLVRWGQPSDGHDQAFNCWNCWGMRTGQPRWSDQGDGQHCDHVHLADGGLALCLPLRIQGSQIGLLCLYPDPAHLPPSDVEGREELLRLAIMAADRIDIGIANVRLRETLREQTVRDPLTGLYNRRHLDDTLQREISRARRSGEPLSLLMMDVDHFKRINDRRGHDFGDRALRLISQTLTDACRGSDLVFRHGGEEFAVLMPGLSPEDAEQKAAELRQRITAAGEQLLDQGPHGLTVSVGIASFPDTADSPQNLMQRADRALYQAKHNGRNCVAVSPKNA